MSHDKRITDSFSQKKKKNSESKFVKKVDLPTCSKVVIDSQDSKDLNILKAFDLKLEYGPCIGITRMERWNRAQKHGLNPPPVVKEIIERHQHDELFQQSLWNDYPTLR